ncbi:MAG: PAS domain S-box protein [Acidobacteria bacterium]|nr:PAS domain S-box protein [Acidobacteriota bacterium]
MSRLAFETILAELSSRFINLAPADVDLEIEDALRRVCEHLQVDLAVLWQWSTTVPDVIVPTHAYPKPEGSPSFDPLNQESYPWAIRQMRAGRIVAVSRLDDLPEEAAVDRESARRTGIISNLCVPLAVGGGAAVGALAFNMIRAPRTWSDELVARLQLVAQVFANALARKRSDQILRASEESSRATFDQAAVGIALVGIDGRWLRVNDRLCAIVGYPREDLLQLMFQDLTHPDDLPSDLTLVRQVLSGELRTYSMEKRYFRKDRSLVWVNLTVSLVRDPAGEPRHFISVLEDISARRRAEDGLRESEARLSAGAELARLAYYEVDFASETAYVDDRFADICGVPSDQGEGLQPLKFWIDHLHPADYARVMDARRQLHEGIRDPFSVEYRFLNPTRGEIWIHHQGRVRSRGADGRPTRTIGVLRDVTDERRAEDELRSLSRRLIRAQEEERALLARELHDDVTQRLAVLAIDVGRAEMADAGGAHAELMASVRDGLVRLSEDIHSLAYQLHPSVLEELGLPEALRTECERRGRRSPIAISMDLQPIGDAIGRDAALCLYRVAQEALSNVVRHSGARTASVVLRQMDGGLFLAVRDDGAGFDPVAASHARRLGLASMRERVQLVNGTLDIESAPGRGTAILAWVPVEGDQP